MSLLLVDGYDHDWQYCYLSRPFWNTQINVMSTVYVKNISTQYVYGLSRYIRNKRFVRPESSPQVLRQSPAPFSCFTHSQYRTSGNLFSLDYKLIFSIRRKQALSINSRDPGLLTRNMLRIGQLIALRHLETFEEFPLMQAPPSYNLAQVMKQIQAQKRGIHNAGHPSD